MSFINIEIYKGYRILWDTVAKQYQCGKIKTNNLDKLKVRIDKAEDVIYGRNK
jgi:hypothetical protein